MSPRKKPSQRRFEMSARTKPSSRAGAGALSTPRTASPFMSYPPAYVPTASEFNSPYGYCPTTNAAYTSSLYGGDAYFPTTSSQFGHKYMPITSASMCDSPYIPRTSAPMGYMSTTSQPFYNDDNYGEYGGETRSQFGQPRATTELSWPTFYTPRDNAMLSGLGAPVLKSRIINDAARAAILGGGISAAYTLGNGVANQRWEF